MTEEANGQMAAVGKQLRTPLQKTAYRVDRLEKRLARLEFCIAREEKADKPDPARLAAFKEEQDEKQAELAFRSRKLKVLVADDKAAKAAATAK